MIAQRREMMMKNDGWILGGLLNALAAVAALVLGVLFLALAVMI